jgi:hypothetical protein
MTRSGEARHFMIPLLRLNPFNFGKKMSLIKDEILNQIVNKIPNYIRSEALNE